jgi:macrodomain Ter protein organizer (MatP/YcbG family)
MIMYEPPEYDGECYEYEGPRAAKPVDKPLNITLQVEGYDEERITAVLDHAIVREVERRANYTITEEVKDRIEKATSAAVKQITEERLKSEINALLDEGWQLTNQYGEPKGEKQSLRQRVKGIFEGKSNGYGNSPTFVEKWIQEAVNYKLQSVLTEEINAARKRLSEAFDEVIRAKFGEELRRLLGLR